MATEVPIRQVYLTELVPPDEIQRAVSLHSSAFNTTRFAGPGICAVLIATVGIAPTFAVAAGLSMLSALAIVVIERIRPARPERSEQDRLPAGPREVVRYLRGSGNVRFVMLLAAGASVLGIMTFQTLAPVYVVTQLGTGGADYAALMATWGAGAVAGAYASAVLVRGERLPWVLLGTGGISVSLAILALSETIQVAILAAGALGASQILVGQNALIAVQTSAPRHLRGQLVAAFWLVFQGSSPLGALLAGGLGEAYGVAPTFVCAAGGLASLSVVISMVAGRARGPA
jgi:predicted MFS family arabinose efflux permease